MSDLEQQLRAAMHAAVDAEEAAPEALIAAVKRRHRRHNLLVAGLAVLIAAAAAIPALIAVQGLVAQPGPPTTGHHHKALPDRMTGKPMPAGSNIGLLTTGNSGASWYFTTSKRTELITGLPAAGYSVNRVQGGWTLSALRIRSFCATYLCAGPPYQYYFVADGSARATHLGSGIADHGAMPSSRPGAVWLVSHAHSSDNIATTSATVQLVSTSGQPLSRRYRLPAGYLIQRGVGPYLLLQQWPNVNLSKPPKSYPAISYLLWNPGTGKVVRRLGNVLIAGPEQIAMSSACRTCRLQILDVTTGTTVTTPITGQQVAGAQEWAMSDDGSLLAMQPHSGAVRVVSTATGALTLISGTDVNFDSWMTLQWQAGSHELVIVTGAGRGPGSNPPTWVQVGYWRPGTTSLKLTTYRDPAEINAIGTG